MIEVWRNETKGGHVYTVIIKYNLPDGSNYNYQRKRAWFARKETICLKEKKENKLNLTG